MTVLSAMIDSTTLKSDGDGFIARPQLGESLMPSFDIVSEVDLHELRNAIDQASREVGTRFDFKGVDASFVLTDDSVITVTAEIDFQIQQMMDILKNKLVKRNVDVRSMDQGEVLMSGQRAVMKVKVLQGIETELAKKIVKLIKDSKIKVQTAIQGEKLRVTGKKRDDLQEIIALVKDAKIAVPLQYNNFRD
jgi:cyclic-di-GMP-binding protein